MRWRCTTSSKSRPRTARWVGERRPRRASRAATRRINGFSGYPLRKFGTSVYYTWWFLSQSTPGDIPMAANVNKVMLLGRLTRDPEVRVFASGGKVAAFGFAVNNRRKNQTTGQWEDDPCF